jgi:hypothetical protein
MIELNAFAGPICKAKLVLRSLYLPVIVIIQQLRVTTLIMRSRWQRP